MKRILPRLIFMSLALGLFGFFVAPATVATAQSPSPSWDMTDVNTYHGYPSGYNAGIVEGLGMIGSCDYTPYTPSEVESEAVSWINSGLQTIIEVTPQTACDTNIGDYESVLNSMSSYIKSNVSSSRFTRYWGGFMLDEEPWYWNDSASSSYSAYTALNNYAFAHTAYGTYSPYSELANASGWWSQSQYNNVAEISAFTAAPQIYTSFMTSEQNSLVATYGEATLVTCEPGVFSPPYNTCSGAYGTINGQPFQYYEWGSGYWYNVFQAA